MNVDFIAETNIMFDIENPINSFPLECLLNFVFKLNTYEHFQHISSPKLFYCVPLLQDSFFIK